MAAVSLSVTTENLYITFPTTPTFQWTLVKGFVSSRSRLARGWNAQQRYTIFCDFNHACNNSYNTVHNFSCKLKKLKSVQLSVQDWYNVTLNAHCLTLWSDNTGINSVFYFVSLLNKMDSKALITSFVGERLWTLIFKLQLYYSLLDITY